MDRESRREMGKRGRRCGSVAWVPRSIPGCATEAHVDETSIHLQHVHPFVHSQKKRNKNPEQKKGKTNDRRDVPC